MPDINEEFYLYVRRHAQFLHVWTVYHDMLSGHYKPTTGELFAEGVDNTASFLAQMGPTFMLLLYAFFYSLIEDSDDSINAFRIWRLKFPEEQTAIDAVEKHVAPMRDDLRVFRNRIAFHGSRTHKHESRGFDLFANQSGTKMLDTMKVFKKLNYGLLAKDLARQHQSDEEMQHARAVLDAIPANCDALNCI